MLESLVANILNRTLGAYVENFDPNQLNIGIWSGDVTLSNLKLKPESLDKLNLPIELKCGHLGNLTMQIPWSNLKSKPVKILIQDCYLLSSAKLPNSYNNDDELAKELRIKKQKLENLQLLSSQSDLSLLDPNDKLKNQSFTDSLISKIIDNLQITIKNIHIRYEDFNCYTKNPYALGFTLDELSAISTDENWIVNFIENVASISRKLMLLKSLTIYLDTSIIPSHSIYSDNKEEMLNNLKNYINLASSDNSNVEYLLQPVSGKGHLTLNKLGPTDDTPHYNLELFFEQFRINLNHLQYCDILETTTQINYFKKTLKFKKNSPNCTIEEDPYKWLQYSFQTIYNEIHQRNYKKTWNYIKKRRDQRLKYITLWKKHLLDENSLTLDEKNELDNLEIECSFEDLKFYRSLAKIQYKKEFKSLPKNKQKQSSNNGWFSSWWNGSTNSDNINNNQKNELKNNEEISNIEITDEQINEFYDAIEFDESKALSDSLDMPRERIKLVIDCKLNTGSFVIRENKNTNNLAEFISQGCHVEFLQRKDSYFIGFKLNKFSVEDGANDTLYKHIVSVKQLNETNDLNSDIFNNDPFFQVSFENNPLSNVAHSELLAKLNSMTIFHNTRFIESIYKFFKPPKAHIDTIGSLMNVANSTINDFTNQTKIGLQYAFEEHKTMNCRMDLQAPLIILPIDPTKWDSPVGILDAGHISIVSDLISEDKYKEIKNEKKDTYTEDDWNKLNTYMYDKYNLTLKDAQILIGPDIKSTIEQLHTAGDREALILDQLNMKFIIELSIIPSFVDLPKLKIGGDVPRFIAMLSDYQYKIFMELLSVSVPNFDNSTNNAIDNDNYNELLEDLNEYSDAQSFFDDDNIIDNIEDLNENNQTKDGEKEEKEKGDNNATDLSNSNAILSPKLNQHSIEFNFNMDLIILSLKRCLDTTSFKAETLVDLVGEKLQLKFYQTQRKMNVDLLLADLFVNDYIETSNIKEFKKLIGSNIKSKDNENLFSVNYTRSLRYANFEGEVIECYDQDIKLDISDFQVVITRKSLLTLLNYSLNTFTDPLAEIPSDKLRHNDEQNVNAPVHINVDINMKSINMILNDDGIKLATLVLERADISVFMLPDSMRASATIGGLNLMDNDTHDGRQLVSIEGDDLADLYYESYDVKTNTLPYTSKFKFETRSMVVVFVEDSFARIYSFLSQFQKMKYIYDSAREAALNQANNVEYPNKMKFDVLIRAPIFVFPKSVDPVNNLYDTITVNLGEIHTFNNFVLKDGVYLNIMKAGLANTNILSSFVVNNNQIQNLKIIDKLDINLDIDYYDGEKLKRPAMIIYGDLIGNDMKLTEFQAFSIIQILQSFPRIMKDIPVEHGDFEDIENDANIANMLITKNAQPEKKEISSVISDDKDGEEVKVLSHKISKEFSTPISIDFAFNIPNVGLTLYNDTCHVIDISDKKLSHFSLNDLAVKFQLFNSGDFKSDLHIKSFVVNDERDTITNVFKNIIPEVKHAEYQFMANIVSINGIQTVNLAIDSPQIYLVMDYLFALKSFADFATHKPKLPVDQYFSHIKSIDDVLLEDEKNEESSNDVEIQNDTKSSIITYKFNIVDPSIVLLANPQNLQSEAIIFKISQLVLNMGEITEMNAVGIGMFLRKMSSDSSNNLRILDDFSFDFILDSRGSNTTSYLTTITSNIEPLLLRLSLRDIYLALDIFNKASEMYNEASGKNINSGTTSPLTGTSIADDLGKKISKYAPSIISSISKASHGNKLKGKSNEPVIIVKGERLKINIQGFRMVLIGDVHELPILDFDVNAFEINAKNWSTELEADTQIALLINIFNYSLSQWEPLLEPWSFAVHIERSTEEKISINVVSRETAEFTVTSRSIATVSHFANLLTEKGELKPRGEDSPYRIINQTGYDLNIWIDDGSDDKSQLTLIKDSETIPWSFEDWRQVRETLTIDTNINYIGVEFLDSIYEPIRKLSLKSEGEDVIMLSPILNNQYHNRLACEIILAEDKVKEVILKSTISVENFTPTPIHIGIGNYDGEFVVDREIMVPSGSKLALPIDYVYNGKLAVRPSTTSEIFGWSNARLQGNNNNVIMSWEYLRDNDLLLECPRIEENGPADYYYFKAHAEYDKKEILNRLYPHMTIHISPPLVVENLLPFDIEWRLFQKGPRKWNDVLRQGANCPIHVIDMNYSAVLKIDVLGSQYNVSAAAIVNTPNDLTTVDKEITLKSNDGQRLSLRLFYSTDTKHGIKVSIYSPYLIVNRTGKDLYIIDSFNTLCSRARTNHDSNEDEYPDMFSVSLANEGFAFFKGNLETNTIQLKVEDSHPSESFSIDKIGQSFEVRVGSKSRNFENDVGIYISEGLGIYNLTKVIMITPRYIIRNDLDFPIYIGLVGSTKVINIDANAVSPIYDLPTYGDKQLTIGFQRTSESMTAAFVVNNVGEIFLRIKKLDSNAHMLLRVVISMEHASIFINILDAKNMWPYSIRNFSDQEFFIYQADPNIDADGNNQSIGKFKPIFYKIPPKSVMPYAWDFPAAEVKELIIRCGNRERYIQLAEIGSLMPMRVKNDNGPPQIYDLNVIADGPIQALMISDYDPTTSMYQLKENKSSVSDKSVSSSYKAEFETNIRDENYYTNIILKFEGIGISLVNTKELYQELCYTTIRGIEFHYNESDIYQTASLKMKWLQIDNQLYSSIFPVVLSPTIIPKSSYDLNKHPVFSTSIARLKDNTHGVNYIKFATILLQELSLEVDEDFLWALLDFSKIPGAVWNSEVKNQLWDKNLEIPKPPTIRSTDDLYFEALHLQPLQFNLSFVRTEHTSFQDTMKTQNALSVAVDVLTMAIGNINNAPVRLSALLLENIRTPVPYLIQNISEHYKQAFLYQLYKVLGSADVLGNPVGLFNNISSGVMDIFYEPYQGYIMTDRPQELGIGLAKGSLSFFKKSVFGVSDSVSRFTNSMAKSLTVASMDKAFQEKRRLARQGIRSNRPADGLSIGATSFFNGISSGIAGLAIAPMEGATREGTAGFFKGLGKGLLGLPTKTATGVFDLANNISESIKNTTTAFDGEGIEKVRLPRYIPYDGSIVKYSKKDSQGQYWLKRCNNGIYSDDVYLSHIVLQGGDYACIVSFSRILVIKVFDLTVDWQMSLENIMNITLEKGGIRIKRKELNEPARFIALPDKDDKRFIYNQIGIAVNEYNKHCIVAL
jgi:vacuolar protein sorting-associated protein 13A/C